MDATKVSPASTLPCPGSSAPQVPRGLGGVGGVPQPLRVHLPRMEEKRECTHTRALGKAW